MSKVISVREQAYELLSGTTAQFMDISKNPTSLSATIEYSLNIVSAMMHKVQAEVERNSTFREELKKAIREKNAEEITRLILDVTSRE